MTPQQAGGFSALPSGADHRTVQQGKGTDPRTGRCSQNERCNCPGVRFVLCSGWPRWFLFLWCSSPGPVLASSCWSCVPGPFRRLAVAPGFWMCRFAAGRWSKSLKSKRARPHNRAFFRYTLGRYGRHGMGVFYPRLCIASVTTSLPSFPWFISSLPSATLIMQVLRNWSTNLRVGFTPIEKSKKKRECPTVPVHRRVRGRRVPRYFSPEQHKVWRLHLQRTARHVVLSSVTTMYQVIL